LGDEKAIMQNHHSTELFSDESRLEACHSYLFSLFQTGKTSPVGGPAITISQQTGSGAHEIAERLAGLLQSTEPKGNPPWTVFDRNLVEKVLEDHYLPKSLAKFIPEDRRSLIDDVLEDLIGLRPPSWVVVPQIAETVLQLADAGHVILVGRGANFITARLPNVFHVRLVASLPMRIARAQKLNHLTPEEAAKFVARSDRGSERYMKAHFHASIDDGVQYHLVINTDLIPCPTAVQLIADGTRRCIQNAAASQTQGKPDRPNRKETA
jgi:Cytidylate kinase-like family